MWPFSGTCRSTARLNGKTVVITGANTGIGKETARDLYWRGARVILACRNLEKAEKAAEDIKGKPPTKPDRAQYQGGPGEQIIHKLDLTKLSSVRECARKLHSTESHIHVLINNAGVMMSPKERTEDGYELQLQSNHLGHFLLTLLLLPKIRDSAPARIVNVSSLAHVFGHIHFDDLNLEKSYTPFKAYHQSKFANVLFTKELVRKLAESEIKCVTTYALHPGVIGTDLGRHYDKSVFPGATMLFNHVAKHFIKSPELGAQTTLHCAVDEAAGKETGLYYSECKVSRAKRSTDSREDAARLWCESLKMVGLPAKENLNDLLDVVTREILPCDDSCASVLESVRL